MNPQTTATLGKSLWWRALRMVGLSIIGLWATLGTAVEHPQGPEASGLRPGMLVNVRGVSFTVPQAGTSVWAEVLFGTGETQVVGVDSHADGRVEIRVGEGVNVMEPVGSSDAGPCTDGAFTTYKKKWDARFEWYFHAGSTPSYVSRTAAEESFRNAVRSIVQGRNDCGIVAEIGARALYRGRTTTKPNITASATCTDRDGRNVVGFGDLPSNYLGVSCWWASGNIMEADIKLNSADFRWVASIPANCSRQWHIGSVATHEFGHIFGIGHVTEDAHPHLTMSQRIASCQNSEMTLGLGDIRALKSLYRP